MALIYFVFSCADCMYGIHFLYDCIHPGLHHEEMWWGLSHQSFLFKQPNSHTMPVSLYTVQQPETEKSFQQKEGSVLPCNQYSQSVIKRKEKQVHNLCSPLLRSGKRTKRKKGTTLLRRKEAPTEKKWGLGERGHADSSLVISVCLNTDYCVWKCFMCAFEVEGWQEMFWRSNQLYHSAPSTRGHNLSKRLQDLS